MLLFGFLLLCPSSCRDLPEAARRDFSSIQRIWGVIPSADLAAHFQAVIVLSVDDCQSCTWDATNGIVTLVRSSLHDASVGMIVIGATDAIISSMKVGSRFDWVRAIPALDLPVGLATPLLLIFDANGRCILRTPHLREHSALATQLTRIASSHEVPTVVGRISATVADLARASDAAFVEDECRLYVLDKTTNRISQFSVSSGVLERRIAVPRAAVEYFMPKWSEHRSEFPIDEAHNEQIEQVISADTDSVVFLAAVPYRHANAGFQQRQVLVTIKGDSTVRVVPLHKDSSTYSYSVAFGPSGIEAAISVNLAQSPERAIRDMTLDLLHRDGQEDRLERIRIDRLQPAASLTIDQTIPIPLGTIVWTRDSNCYYVNQFTGSFKRIRFGPRVTIQTLQLSGALLTPDVDRLSLDYRRNPDAFHEYVLVQALQVADGFVLLLRPSRDATQGVLLQKYTTAGDFLSETAITMPLARQIRLCSTSTDRDHLYILSHDLRSDEWVVRLVAMQ